MSSSKLALNLSGRIVVALELRYTPAGKPITSFKMVVNGETYTNKATGEIVTPTTWFKVQCFGATAEWVAAACDTGSFVDVESEFIEVQSWTNRNGEAMSTLVVNAKGVTRTGQLSPMAVK